MGKPQDKRVARMIQKDYGVTYSTALQFVRQAIDAFPDKLTDDQVYNLAAAKIK